MFDDLSLLHDIDGVGDLGDDAHVMGDEQHRRAVALLQFVDQRQDLLLRGHVQRGRGFVRDQQDGFQNQRHRDHDPLALAARQLMRIAAEDAFDIGQMDLLHDRHGATAALRGGQVGVQLHHLHDLVAHAQDRVQCGHGLLEDHRNAGRAQVAHLGLRQGQQVAALQPDRAPRDAQRVGQQPHDRQRGDGFPRPGFAHQADGLARADGHVDALQDRGVSRRLGQGHGQVAGLKHHVGRVEIACLELHQPALFFSRGSSMSRAASPRRLIDRMHSDSAMPG